MFRLKRNDELVAIDGHVLEPSFKTPRVSFETCRPDSRARWSPDDLFDGRFDDFEEACDDGNTAPGDGCSEVPAARETWRVYPCFRGGRRVSERCRLCEWCFRALKVQCSVRNGPHAFQ